MSEDTNPYDQMTASEQIHLNTTMQESVLALYKNTVTIDPNRNDRGLWNMTFSAVVEMFKLAVAATGVKNTLRQQSALEVWSMIKALNEDERTEWDAALVTAVQDGDWRSFFEICEYYLAPNAPAFSLNDCSEPSKSQERFTTYTRAPTVSPDF
jgi:hypothetical protein